MSYDLLFSPFKVRGLELKNRVVMPGMNTKFTRNKHDVSEAMVEYYAARARGGCGLVITECLAVCPEPHAIMYMGIYTDKDVQELKKIVDAVHEGGAAIAAQIWHGGESPQFFFDETNKLETPATLTVERIHEIVEQFGQAAARCVEAGFDAIEFHSAHNYLPHAFLSPGMNHRDDEYGGSFENRCRFSLEVIESIRKNIPEDMPLIMRVGCIDELMEENMTEQEIVDFINLAADKGVDIANLSRGNASTFATVYEVPPFNLAQGFNIENIAKIKQQIKIPAIGVGRINYPALAEKCLEEGKFDLVAIGRGQIADPEWCNKAKEDRAEDIRMCIACDQGCYDSVIAPQVPHITCTRNPFVGKEYIGVPQTDAPKKVMIIGGGMGGMMAAEILKQRGHEPVIFEASDILGGQFRLAGVLPTKHEWLDAVNWEAKEVEKMGIEVRYNTVVTPEVIEEFKPDDVIIAIGSDYVAPAIEGIDGPNVYTQYQVLKGEVEPKGRVAVVGAGLVGVEVAELLAGKGCQVTALEAKGVGRGLNMLRKMFMAPEFGYFKIAKVSGAQVYKIDESKAYYGGVDKKTGEAYQRDIDIDCAVICTGIKSRPSEDLQAKCEELGIPVQVIGDARKAGDTLAATAGAYAVAMAL